MFLCDHARFPFPRPHCYSSRVSSRTVVLFMETLVILLLVREIIMDGTIKVKISCQCYAPQRSIWYMWTQNLFQTLYAVPNIRLVMLLSSKFSPSFRRHELPFSCICFFTSWGRFLLGIHLKRTAPIQQDTSGDVTRPWGSSQMKRIAMTATSQVHLQGSYTMSRLNSRTFPGPVSKFSRTCSSWKNVDLNENIRDLFYHPKLASLRGHFHIFEEVTIFGP